MGKAVNKLRKAASGKVAEAARELVKSWKAAVAKAKAVAGAGTAPARPPPVSPPKASASASAAAESPAPSPTSVAPSYERGHGEFTLGGLAEPVRNKVQRMIHESLQEPQEGGAPPVVSRVEAAVRIENAMIVRYRGVGREYKAKFRELAPNLRNKSNPELCWSIYDGHLPPEKLISMEPQELASAEVKRAREQARKDAIDAARCDWDDGGATVDMFRCGKCKQRKTTFYQLQTRSADEPMTTFITCKVCGNKWRE